MTRHYPDWLSEFLLYASNSEAPMDTLYWSGVSAVAGALRRRVYLDMGEFQWFANHYIILVAPPGVISKTTTANTGMRLLREVEGIRFGPDVVTWQSLVTNMAECTEEFLNPETGEYIRQSAMTICSDEMGNLIDPQNLEMMNIYISLWDAKGGWFEKQTKGSGNDKVANPWLNIIACTTPSWIASSFSDQAIGGGFTSRCVFVFADTKRQRIAYPRRGYAPDHYVRRKRLVEDLAQIAEMCGEYELTEGAYALGTKWYAELESMRPKGADADRMVGNWARMQTHVHKLAMVIAASRSNTLKITEEILAEAIRITKGMERNVGRAFELIGRSDDAMISMEVLKIIDSQSAITATEVKAFLLRRYSPQQVGEAIEGLLQTPRVKAVQQGAEVFLVSTLNPPTRS